MGACRVVVRAYMGSPLCLRLPGRHAFGASTGGWHAFGASTASPFGNQAVIVVSGFHQCCLEASQKLTGRNKSLLAKVKCAQMCCWRCVSQTGKHGERSSLEHGMHSLLRLQISE